MTQDWREDVPDNRLANEAVYDEWLAKPSWTLPEAVYLIVGLDPSKMGHPCNYKAASLTLSAADCADLDGEFPPPDRTTPLAIT